MSSYVRVLLGHRGVGGDVAVEEIVGECAQQVGYGTRQLVQVREDRLAQVDMRAGRPRVRSDGEQAYPEQAGRGRREEIGRASCRERGSSAEGEGAAERKKRSTGGAKWDETT